MPVVLGVCVSLGHPHSRNIVPHLLGTLVATSTKPELATPQVSGAPIAKGPAGSCSKLGCQILDVLCVSSLASWGWEAHNAEDGASLALRKRGEGKLDVLNRGSGSCHWREHSRTASDKATHIRLAVSLDVGRGMHGAQRPRMG